MGVVTEEDVQAAAAVAAEARRTAPPRLRGLANEPFDALESAVSAQALANYAASPAGVDLRLADRRRRELAALRERQQAALVAHRAAEEAAAARLVEVAAELQASAARVRKACSKGTLIDVGVAAREHDTLVRGLVRELHERGLPLCEHELEHEVGALADGGKTGLQVAGTLWLSIDAFELVMWRSCAEFASLFGNDHPFVMFQRRTYRLDQLDGRPDDLVGGVTLPKAGPSVRPAQPKRVGPTELLVMGDPHAAVDENEAAALRKSPPGHHTYIRNQASRQREALTAEGVVRKTS